MIFFRIYDKFVFLATKCEVYSIRATCFNALGLIGSTNAGANVLFKLSKYFLFIKLYREWIYRIKHHYRLVECST